MESLAGKSVSEKLVVLERAYAVAAEQKDGIALQLVLLWYAVARDKRLEAQARVEGLLEKLV